MYVGCMYVASCSLKQVLLRRQIMSNRFFKFFFGGLVSQFWCHNSDQSVMQQHMMPKYKNVE